MNIFKSVKEAVSVMDAASFYGIKINRSGLCNCPFHNDKTPMIPLMNVLGNTVMMQVFLTSPATNYVSLLHQH